MPVTLTNPTLSNPASKTEVEDNFSDLADKFNAGIVDADVSATAAIQTSKLASRDYEFLVHGDIRIPTSSTATHADYIEFSSTTVPSLLIPFPGTSTDGTYTVLSGSWFCTDTGDNTTDFKVVLGYFNTATGAWVDVTTIATVTNMTSAAGANTAGQGALTITGATLTLDASIPYCVAVFFTGAEGAGFMNGSLSGATSPDLFSITLKVRRTNGLRGT